MTTPDHYRQILDTVNYVHGSGRLAGKAGIPAEQWEKEVADQARAIVSLTRQEVIKELERIIALDGNPTYAIKVAKDRLEGLKSG